MIIDLILDRKDGEPYNPKDFYTNVLAYEDVFKFEPTISKAMDYGEEEDVKRALCDYINRQNYNPSICDYINSVNWLTSSKKVVKSAANSLPEGSDYYEWVSYDVWGNEEDGWEVNDTSRFSDKRVVIHDDLTGLEVLKVLCAEGIINRQYINDIDVEFLDDYYIELTEKDTGKPIGRLEKVQDIESSRKPIKSAVSDDKWELVDELCNRAIAEMNGDRDAMFFTRMSNGFIVKGKYIDEYESSTGITNPHKLWKKIVMVLGVDELVPITEGTFRKYYELGVKWVGMEIQNSRKTIKSSDADRRYEEYTGNRFNLDEYLPWLDNNKLNRELAGYFGKDKVEEFYNIIGDAKTDFDGYRIKLSYSDYPDIYYYVKVSNNGLYELHLVNHQGWDSTIVTTHPRYGVDYFFDQIRQKLPESIQSSHRLIKSSEFSEELEQAFADLGDAESDFELVFLVRDILDKHGMSEKYHDFCEEIDKAKSWKGMGDVAEKYILMAIKSSHKPIKSADKPWKGKKWDVYYPAGSGIKEPYVTDDFDEAMRFRQEGFKVKPHKESEPVKSSTTWVAGKSENGNKSFYCEDGKFYAEEDYGRPSIKVFNNKDDAEKIAKRSKSGFIQVLDEYDD